MSIVIWEKYSRNEDYSGISFVRRGTKNGLVEECWRCGAGRNSDGH